MFILVRHAHAGDRSTWPLVDSERPLSEQGQHQAAGVAEAFAGLGVTRLLSSPYRRCRQTLGPLAERTGLVVDLCPLLDPDARPGALDRMLREAEGSVLCTHGETLAALLRHWHRRSSVSLPVRRRQISKGLTEKGGSWVVEDHGDGPSAHYLRPVQVVRLPDAGHTVASA